MEWQAFGKYVKKREVISHLTSPDRFNAEYELVRSSVKTNHIWHLLKHRQEDAGYLIALDVLKRKGSAWHHVLITEVSNPIVYDCPSHWLTKPCFFTDWDSQTWRRKALAELEANKNAQLKANKLEPGMDVVFQDVQYILVKDLGNLGWQVEEVSTGKLYRMKLRQLIEAIRND